MIRSYARRFASAISLVAIVAMAAPALADTPSATTWTDYHYETTITTVYGSPYPIAGKLDIQITQAGVLRGYYHNAYQKAFIQVVGGRDGNYIWFDIGPATADLGIPGVEAGTGHVHVVGTMSSDGSIHGQLFPFYGSDAALQATANAAAIAGKGPANAIDQNSVPDQYLFAAKPTEKTADTTNPGGP
jgi:hypothetical protein